MTHIHHQIVIFSQRPINCQLPNFLKRPTFIIRLYFFLKDPLIKRFPIFSQDSLSSYQHAAKLLKSKHCEKINSKLKSWRQVASRTSAFKFSEKPINHQITNFLKRPINIPTSSAKLLQIKLHCQKQNTKQKTCKLGSQNTDLNHEG